MILFISPRNIIFILGVILVLRLVGKMMSARRNIQDQKTYRANQANTTFEKERSKRNFGRTTIGKVDQSKIPDTEYTDFEEID